MKSDNGVMKPPVKMNSEQIGVAWLTGMLVTGYDVAHELQESKLGFGFEIRPPLPLRFSFLIFQCIQL